MTNPTGMIEAWEGIEVEDRAEVVIPTAWVNETSGQHSLIASPGGGLLNMGECEEALPTVARDEPLLFLLGSKPPAAALDAMLEAADQGSRVYVLAESGFGDGGAEHGLCTRGDARVLIRRVEGLPCSAIIADRGASAGVFLGESPLAEAQWWLGLSPDQGEALFRAALGLFWHEAQDEGWTSRSGIRFQPPVDPPFDVPLNPSQAPVQLLPAGSGHPEDEVLPTWHHPGSVLPGRAMTSLLLVPPSGNKHPALRALFTNGARVAWSPLGLPPFSTDGKAGWLTSATKRLSLTIRLNPQQGAALQNLATRATRQAAWSFQVDAPLATLRGEAWLADAKGAKKPDDNVEVSCGSWVAESLRTMTREMPTEKPSPPPLARKVRWVWTVNPPELPKGARDDQLVKAWSKLDSDVTSRLDTLADGIAAIEARESTLSDKFANLASAILGFRRTRSSLRTELDQLRANEPSMEGPEGAAVLLDRLEALDQKVTELGGRLEDAEMKELERQEREKQLDSFNATQREAEAKVPDLQAELAEKQEEERQVEIALGELARGDTELSRKDRKARQKKLKNDQDRVSKRISRLEQLIAEAQGTLEQTFVFQPPRSLKTGSSRKGGNRFVPSAKKSEPLHPPQERLPSIGQLKQHKNTRYLAIGRWEHLDEGEQEAQRLGAQLVATAEDA
jgi:predicted transcriptional regulator